MEVSLEALYEASRNLIDLLIPFLHAEEEDMNFEEMKTDGIYPFFPFKTDSLISRKTKKEFIDIKRPKVRDFSIGKVAPIPNQRATAVPIKKTVVATGRRERNFGIY
ncbi:hypothetical protein IEQ34_024172 [Dendrobium chrysotoxum]|uniref:Uncharacterized protein n=1 Tax=Dendrobium chrysotoxum TaxID=161865 RepID=A0AAV7FUC9_DENCH|nr:hypothetical protein IEQ34_024172 [Dendrobium chrysotoxum]